MEHLELRNNNNIVRITSVDDLSLLPEKSINILFNNPNHMVTLYVYVLYRIDTYLQEKNYSRKKRIRYFNTCVKNLDSLVEYENRFLTKNSTTVVIKFEKLPRNLERIYTDSLISTCSFFSGMLSTTSYLDRKIFSRKEIQTMRHNYSNMISALINSVAK
jgi:hypothetical protein